MLQRVIHIFSLRALSVGARLLLINALLMLALGIVSVLAWHSLDVQSRAMNELGLISKAARYHQDADTLHATLRADVNRALASADMTPEQRSALTDSLDANAMDLRRDLQTLDKLDLPPELAESEQKVRRLAEAFLSRAIDTGRLAIRDPHAAQATMAAFEESIAALHESMDQQTVMMSRHVVAANDDAADAAHNAKRWILGAFIATGLATGALVALVSASIRSSLRRVRDVASAMQSGNLGVRCPAGGSDEISQLARALNSMADHLSSMITQLRADADRDAFGTQLVEALEMADSEEEAHATVARAMATISCDMPMELLIADSSRAHLERATQHPLAGAPGCGVESPFSCVAVRRGNPVTFPDSEALNACSRLRGRECGSVSAACIPVSFMGRSLGVLHATSSVGHTSSALELSHLTTLGIQAGARIGTVRAFQKTQRQASTDSLTGLLNRRSLEEAVRNLAGDGQDYAVVIADLDHFKKLNDLRGHEAGDTALRQFADVLRKTLRDHDVAARWGGEEFVLVLPRVDAHKAVEIIDRLRASLAEAQLLGNSPTFTASFGVADSAMSPRFEQLVRIADDALYTAKSDGRDRAVVGNPGNVSSSSMPRRAMEHPATVDMARLVGNG